MYAFYINFNKTFFELFKIMNGKKEIASHYNDFENGDWRYKYFKNFIMNNICLTALSKSERDKIPQESYSMIEEACCNIRLTNSKNDSGRGSEIAEILLYGIMQQYYHALPVIPKIFYKQNPNDYAKGSDGVHIVIENNDFSLWFGEAKFYKDLNDVNLKRIAESVRNSLDTNKIRKENAIITDLNDLKELLKVYNEDIQQRIFEFLDKKTSVDRIKHHLHIPIMLLYECHITQKQIELTTEYLQKIEKAQVDVAKKYFQFQDEECKDVFKYDEVTFHLIYFPVPDKNRIVDIFVKEVEHYRGNE